MRGKNKMAKKKKDNKIIILIILSVLAAVCYLAKDRITQFVGLSPEGKTEDMLKVELYNANYTKLSDSQQQLFAIVNNIQDVKYAKFFVNTKNTGAVTFKAYLQNATPTQLYNAFSLPQQGITVAKEDEYTWTSNYIALDQFANSTTDFSVVMTAEFDNGKDLTKKAKISLDIKTGAVDVNTGGGGGITNTTNETDGAGNSSTDLCTGVNCRSFCNGIHYAYNGFCRVDNVTFNGTSTISNSCYFANYTFYASRCGWDTAVNITCGDGFCHATECCYQPEVSKRYECQETATICSTVNDSCNQDCMYPEYAALYRLPPIQLS
jgi:hypothetical protein